MNEFSYPILAVVFVGMGLYMRREGARLQDRVERSVTWPTVKGEITRSEVVRSSRGGKRGLEPRVEFAYTVDDRRWEAKTPVLGIWLWSGDGRAICERYPLGATVDVTYDPMDPSVAFLERGRTDPRIMQGLAAAAFVAAGVFLVLAARFFLG